MLPHNKEILDLHREDAMGYPEVYPMFYPRFVAAGGTLVLGFNPSLNPQEAASLRKLQCGENPDYDALEPKLIAMQEQAHLRLRYFLAIKKQLADSAFQPLQFFDLYPFRMSKQKIVAQYIHERDEASPETGPTVRCVKILRRIISAVQPDLLWIANKEAGRNLQRVLSVCPMAKSIPGVPAGRMFDLGCVMTVRTIVTNPFSSQWKKNEHSPEEYNALFAHLNRGR